MNYSYYIFFSYFKQIKCCDIMIKLVKSLFVILLCCFYVTEACRGLLGSQIARLSKHYLRYSSSSVKGTERPTTEPDGIRPSSSRENEQYSALLCRSC